MITLTFIDFDHENERHAEITLQADNRVLIERAVETNPDYLSEEAEIPEDWSDVREVEFSDLRSAKCFIQTLADQLLDQCFSYFHENEEVDDSDDARRFIAEILELHGDSDGNNADLAAELCIYPR